MDVDTGSWRALTAEVAAARAEKDAVLKHIGALYAVAYEHGMNDARELDADRPPLRLVR